MRSNHSLHDKLIASPAATGNGVVHGFRSPLRRVPKVRHPQYLSFRGKLGSDIHRSIAEPAFGLDGDSGKRLANVVRPHPPFDREGA